MGKDLAVNDFSSELFELVKKHYPNIIDDYTREHSTLELSDLNSIEIEFDNVHKFFNLAFDYTKFDKDFHNTTQVTGF